MRVRLGTWNVNGLGKRPMEVGQIMHTTGTPIMFLTEIFQGWSKAGRPNRIQLRGNTQSIPGKQRNAGRTHAGITFVSRAGKVTRILANDAE
jgi:hypothetical protein